MTIRQHLDCLAVSFSFAEPNDEAAMRDVLANLGKLQVSEGEEDVPELLARICAEAAEKVQALVDGAEPDADAAFAFITQVIEFAQEIVEKVEAGGSADGMCPPWEADAQAEPEIMDSLVDDEMIEMFICECGDTLKEVEGQLLELEKQPDSPETISEIRRRVHTFKGECGVLSLEVAQSLCHEAETMIDRAELSGELPIDLLLDLVDWLGRHVNQLKDTPRVMTPGHEELLERIKAVCPDGEVQPDEETKVIPVSTARIEFTQEALEDETMPEFIEEACGHLEEVEAALLEREDNPDDVETLNRMFRAFHTIKGVAGFLNLEPVVRLAHRTETLLDEFRTGRLDCTQDHVEMIFSAKDILGAMFDAMAGAEAPLVSAVDELAQKLDSAIDAEKSQATPAAKPPSAAAEEASEPAVENTLEDVKTTEAKAPQAPSVPEPEAAAPAKVEEPKAEEPKAAPKKPARKIRTESFVKVGTQRLDSLVDMVGELVIAQQMVSQEPALEAIESENLARKLGHVAKITRDLQEGAMSLRMVTLKPTFQKMARLVRDVANKSGKNVKLSLIGEDTELDRNVVEQIGDPLVHLIRNSIDHGLESPEDRVAAGKPEQGLLELSSYHQGGSIVIDVRDDGGGLNCDRIFNKALERGLIPEGTGRHEMSDEEIHKMIFQAGFSTAAQVSDISGRGVGMDVVRRNIESMRGKVEIKSEQGVGSTFTLRLPLTLAIIDGMVVRVGDRRYVLPTLTIEQSFRPTEQHLHDVLGEGEVVNVRGALVPVHRIKHTFGLTEGVEDVTKGILILLEANGQRACFLVDEILGQQQVVIKNLGKALPAMQGVSGGAILGDGRVALILDVDGLLAAAQCV